MPRRAEGRQARRASPAPVRGDDSSASLAEASNPLTPPARLHQLARHRNRTIRNAVAANPNASRRDLVSLALVMPETVAANPVLEWWLLEDANWLASIDERARHGLLAASAMAEGTRWWAARFGAPEDKAALILCPHTNIDVLDYLADTDEDYEVLVSNHVSMGQGAGSTSGNVTNDIMIGELIVDSDDARDLLAHGVPSGWALELLDLSSTDLRRAVAAHAAATPPLLARLLLDDDDRTIRYAERNPAANQTIENLSISARELAKRVRNSDPELTVEELRAVRESPMGLQCLASHPNATTDMIAELCVDASWTIRQVAAGSSRLSVSQLERLAIDDDRDVRVAAAQNPALAIAILRSLQHDRDELVRTQAKEAAEARHDEVPVALTSEEIATRMKTGRAGIAAVYPNLSLKVQQALAASEDWRVRHRLATNPTVSQPVLDQLSRDADLDVRKATAQNPNTSLATRLRLCKDDSPEIRAVSIERVDDPNALDAAVNDHDVDVLQKLATNPAAPFSAMRALINDDRSEVRLAIAQRSTLPDDVVLRLAADVNDDVRAAIVGRPDVSIDALELAFSPLEAVVDESLPAGERSLEPRLSPAHCREVFIHVTRSAPDDRFSTTSQLTDAGDPRTIDALVTTVPWVAKLLAELPATNPEIQARLVKSTDWRVREALARRSDAQIEVLRGLINDSDYDTRSAVAANPRTPPDCLPLLARDGHRATRMNVLDRADVSEELLEILALDDEEEIREIAGEKAVRRPVVADVLAALVEEREVDPRSVDPLLDSPFVRKLAAGHPSTTSEQLERLATDQMWEIRELVAAHVNASKETLVQLGVDPDRDVRRGVAENPNTPSDVVASLQDDPDRSVARVASARVARGQTRDFVPRPILQALRSKSVPTRILALSCQDIPERELRRRRHYMSVDWRERFAVAAHPRTPTEILSALGADGLHVVRATARRSSR